MSLWLRKNVWLVLTALGVAYQAMVLAMWLFQAGQAGWLPGGDTLAFLFTALGFTWLGLSLAATQGGARTSPVKGGLALACVVIGALLQIGQRRFG